jgi:DHA1 family inner membrane transport protein
MGSATGGLLYAHELFRSLGFVAAAFVAMALTAVILSRPARKILAS